MSVKTEETRTQNFQLSLSPAKAKAIAKSFMIEQGAPAEYAENNLRSRSAVYQQLKQWVEVGQQG